jgi:hemolysin activation/secretion protein
VDFRRLESAVEAAGAAVDAAADTGEWVAEFTAERVGGRGSAGVTLAAVYSPGGWTEDHEDASHAALRPGAEAEFVLGRAAFWGRQSLAGGWGVVVHGAGQWSSDPVLTTDQIWLGGAQAVRGFEEASGLGDSGFWGGVEVQAPESALGRAGALTWQPVAFAEGGWARDLATDDGFSIAGAGVGLRLRWDRRAVVAFDYGWRLTEPGGRAHVSVRIEF